MKLRILLVLAFAFSLGLGSVHAQQGTESPGAAPSKLVFQATRDRYREQFNENALFLMGGPLGQSDIAYASDISTVVDNGLDMRVLPVVGAAAAQNVKDVLYLRGVDVALTDTTTLNALRRSQEAGPNLDKQIAYISVLYPQELHILARPEIGSVEDLRGKRVNFDIAGSGSALHVPGIFQALGLEVQPFNMSQPDAIEKMRRSDLDATVCICAKPVNAFLAIKPVDRLKLIGVPYVTPLQGDLLPAPITAEDYPGLLAVGSDIETIAATAVLITFNWPKDSTRYERTAKFVDAFFFKFPDLLKPPRQPGWQVVNLAATIPGWQRFPAAQEWLEKNNQLRSSAVQAEFEKFSAERREPGEAPTAADNDRLFREFLEHRAARTN
jgi:TRAP-type uncharacterized transport system substrate-binding protein